MERHRVTDAIRILATVLFALLSAAGTARGASTEAEIVLLHAGGVTTALTPQGWTCFQVSSAGSYDVTCHPPVPNVGVVWQCTRTSVELTSTGTPVSGVTALADCDRELRSTCNTVHGTPLRSCEASNGPEILGLPFHCGTLHFGNLAAYTVRCWGHFQSTP